LNYGRYGPVSVEYQHSISAVLSGTRSQMRVTPAISLKIGKSGVSMMTEEELKKKIEELKADHIAAGGFISDEEAEEVIKKACCSKSKNK
jgi:hypothetical protein